MELKCCDCNASFTFTISQQKFYKSKGFQNPRRCANCKQVKKEFHEGIKRAFEKNCTNAPPKKAVICSWCGNPCHSESYCRYKISATCTKCGKIGYPASKGFARGIRTNTVRMACDCNAPLGFRNENIRICAAFTEYFV